MTASLKCLQKANEVSPKNVDVQKEMSVVMSLIKKQKVSERELARRMFSGPKNSDSKQQKKTKRESNKVSFVCVTFEIFNIHILNL